jgi:methyltransferase
VALAAVATDWMGFPQVIVLLVALQRLGELVLARHNTERLLRAGAREVGRRHYPLFVLLHGGWLLALFVLTPPERTISASLLTAFILLQAARVWVVASLGPYWTTRVITVPDAPLVRRGPFRWLRHPNYVVVTAEIAILPLAFGQWELALVFSLLNALLLRHRVRVENAALRERHATDKSTGKKKGGRRMAAPES